MSSGRWGDLAPRVISAIVMLAIGGLAIWAGGWAFAALAIAVCGLMVWELARMTEGAGGFQASVLLGLLGGLALGLNLLWPHPLMLGLLLMPSVFGLMVARRDPMIYAAYALVIMLTGFALVCLRVNFGIVALAWLLAVVVASDVLGYFAGRILGGPKFWPRVSPKKTWSGTVAGWIGAAIVGLGFWQCGYGSMAILWVSPLVGFAGQMGDIVESAIKRRMGVKDSSGLIPGHGGVMDRFDALAFGAILTMILQALLAFLPQAQG